MQPRCFLCLGTFSTSFVSYLWAFSAAIHMDFLLLSSVYVCACVRACMHACVCVCVRAHKCTPTTEAHPYSNLRLCQMWTVWCCTCRACSVGGTRWRPLQSITLSTAGNSKCHKTSLHQMHQYLFVVFVVCFFFSLLVDSEHSLFPVCLKF